MVDRTWSPPKDRRGWTLVAILISLYLTLLQSLAECVLVIQLYAMKRVDSIMTPSLILSLVASLFSIPFIVLHTFLAWQFKKSPGFSLPRTRLHIACSYLPHLMIILWLAATAAGLVVVSKQPTCVAGHSEVLWKVGVSCVLHRASVIVAVSSFIAVCALFCAIELCERPYDASLMGLYAPQRPPRDKSLFSSSSRGSETLKNEIYLCGHPNEGPGNGELYLSPNVSSIMEQPVLPPSIPYPAPVQTRPQLRLGTHPASVRTEINRQSSSPDDISPKAGSAPKSVSGSVVSGSSPISQIPTPAASQKLNEPDISIPAIAGLAGNPKISSSPAKSKHTRQKSSASSRRRFLPKAWLKSDPLSTQPRLIRQTSCPSPTPAVTQTQTPNPESNPSSGSQTPRPRAMSTNPGNPPPILPPQPLTIRKSRSFYAAPPPHSIYRPHHQNYVPPPPNHPCHSPPLPSSHTDGTRRHYPRRHSSLNSPHYQFERPPILRHSQNHHYHHRQQDPRRYNLQHRFDPSRALPPIPHSDDVEIVYPSTRRPQCSVYGLARDDLCIMRAGTRSSVNLSSGAVSTGAGNAIIDHDTYRGPQRRACMLF